MSDSLQKNVDIQKSIASFLDEQGRLTQFPAKRKKKNYALFFLADKFEMGRVYSEFEVNELLERWHTFHDPATLRRELYNNRFFDRTSDCREYRLCQNQPTIEELEKRYG